ncbi:hypothetical protein HELRODRAFT_161611 [Helobdella robusta]|uniref:Uncharacterized protein n=1 Tax=Helobdella robusta TaxID=6412 RepID=T1ERP8_HELRO|nr:hypothetical protein HELRODRAFT_161611 [Helobdella robusta]ESO02353.1 hypothetical protein HELRODRAFT_161611 [Helobdella robusta]
MTWLINIAQHNSSRNNCINKRGTQTWLNEKKNTVYENSFENAINVNALAYNNNNNNNISNNDNHNNTNKMIKLRKYRNANKNDDDDINNDYSSHHRHYNHHQHYHDYHVYERHHSSDNHNDIKNCSKNYWDEPSAKCSEALYAQTETILPGEDIWLNHDIINNTCLRIARASLLKQALMPNLNIDIIEWRR